MSESFIPFAERIPLGGVRPDPLPDLSEALDLTTHVSPEEIGPILLPPPLRFKEGCYKIRMEPTGLSAIMLSPFFAGTMRVETGESFTTISGDFYRFDPLGDMVLQRSRLSSVLLDHDTELTTAPQIPIFPRRRYHSFLRAIEIRSNTSIIILTVEQINYTHPQPGDATGSFSGSPDRVLTIVLHPIPNPEGFSGPSFQGSVSGNGQVFPVTFTMLWVSDFFRRAKVELENVKGVPIVSAAGGNDFPGIYSTAGWDLEIVTGDTDLAVPAGVSATDPWSRAELHQFMLANRNPAADLDKEWRYYHVFVPFDAFIPGLAGVMFDEIQEQREGSCNFIQNFTDIHNDDRVKLRSAAHEIGHGFNQLHPPDESLSNDNSIMTQTGSTQTVIESGGGTYPDDINFSFNDHDRHHLIHFPDVVVRPGGEDFTFGHGAGFAPEAFDRAAAAGMELQIALETDRLKLGEPLGLRVELKNNGRQSIPVPKNIGTEFHVTEITVHKSGETPRHFRSFVIVCDNQRYIELQPGASVGTDEVVYWDSNGFLFRSPGVYVVSASVAWEGLHTRYAVEASARVWVDYPVDDRDNQIASLLMNDEVGKYVALGGNARHLKEAVSRIEQATRAGQEHPALQRILKIDETTKKNPRRKK